MTEKVKIMYQVMKYAEKEDIADNIEKCYERPCCFFEEYKEAEKYVYKNTSIGAYCIKKIFIKNDEE